MAKRMAIQNLIVEYPIFNVVLVLLNHSALEHRAFCFQFFLEFGFRELKIGAIDVFLVFTVFETSDDYSNFKEFSFKRWKPDTLF